MRVLVAIANHGEKNRRFLQSLLLAYRTMRHDVDIVVLSDAPKDDLGSDVEVRVGAPTANPWSLPFAHRSLFAERADDYDLYVYSEDDTLVTEEHLDAFCEVNALLEADEVPGFLRYEEHPDGRRSYCSVHSGYHWDPTSVRTIDGELFAEFTNQHSACYVLTRDQLRRALDSGEFLVEPHEGLYDMLVSAATDPYVRCGLRRVLCVSRIDEFLLHHLPNVYLGQLGVGEREWSAQLEAIEMIADGRLERRRLFPTQTRMAGADWGRHYHPRPDNDLVALLARPARTVLSVGAGDGVLERTLYPDADRIVGIPLDEIIAAVARLNALETVPPDLDQALAAVVGDAFEIVLLHDVLGRVPDPVLLLERVRPLVASGGEVLATTPNHVYHRLRYWTRRELAPPVPPRGRYDVVGVRPTGPRDLPRWLRASGYRVEHLGRTYGSRFVRVASRAPGVGALLGLTVVASGRPRL